MSRNSKLNQVALATNRFNYENSLVESWACKRIKRFFLGCRQWCPLSINARDINWLVQRSKQFALDEKSTVITDAHAKRAISEKCEGCPSQTSVGPDQCLVLNSAYNAKKAEIQYWAARSYFMVRS